MNSFLETLKKLGPTRLAVMGAVLLGLLLFFVFVSMRVAGPEMKILYNDLSAQDSTTISSKLDELQIPYDLSADGTKIMVSDKDVGRARMELAQAGSLPNGGNLGYEIFDKQSSFGTTNFVQNVNQVRALEGELARTIGSLEPIKSARVHLVLPQRELFSRENRSASASVFIQMKGADELDRKQIAGIQSLIASAVPNMKPKDVSIIDSQGNLLAQGGEDENDLMSGKSEELSRDYERRMSQTIEDLLGRTVGFGKVRATVTADLNFDRVTESAETYDPQSQVVRSAQTTEETGSETDASNNDNVSVDNNLPNANASAGTTGGTSSNNNRTEETTNFEISKVVRNVVSETGEVKRLSVAVLIDGTYTTNAEGVRTYQPRSAAELASMKSLISSAIGFDETRGDKLELVNMQFAEIETVDPALDTQLFGFEKADLLDMAEILTVAIMIILVVLLVLQPMVGRLLATAGPPIPEDEYEENPMLANMQAGQAQLSGPSSMMDPGAYAANTAQMDDMADNLIDVQKVEGRVKASSLKRVEDIITAYPEETVSVLRNWMTQES
jgi:flagellar M-ring protein FliF